MSTVSIQRVLVPVDFGEASASAMRVAAAIAEKHHAELTVVHAEVLDAPPYFTSGQVEALERERHAARAAAEAYVRTFARGATSQPVAAIVADGAPTDAVLKTMLGHDLIVMGTHGRRGPTRWWLGSVAEQVIRSASIPVLIVRPGTTDPDRVFERIVWFGNAPAAGTAHDWATTLASPFGGGAVEAPSGDPFEAARQLAATLVVVTAATDLHRTGVDRVAGLFVRACGRPVLFVPEPTTVSA